jgi:hypothetical protein
MINEQIDVGNLAILNLAVSMYTQIMMIAQGEPA